MPLSQRLSTSVPADDIHSWPFALIFLVGASLQVGPSSNTLSFLYAGKVIAGFGVGGMNSITPASVAEAAPAAVRGRITGLFQEFLVLGTTISYWLDYGGANTIPLGVQLIPGGIIFLGVLF